MNNQRGRINWAGVDWSRRDAELAKALGVSREAVRLARRRAGAPRSPDHRMSTVTVAAREEVRRLAARAPDALRQLSAAERRVLAGGPSRGSAARPDIHTVTRIRRRLVAAASGRGADAADRPTYGAAEQPWELVNWALPNVELERVWRTPPNAVANARSRQRHGPPAWNLRTRRNWSKSQAKSLETALKAERAKAERWFRLKDRPYPLA